MLEDVAWNWFRRGERELAEQALRDGVAAASSAIDAAGAADAFERRGLLLYQAWLLNAPVAFTHPLAQAAEDLRLASRSDPARMESWLGLSQVNYARALYDEAYAAAQNAYGLDASGHRGNELLNLLFHAAASAGYDDAAAQWCAEIRARMRGNWMASGCIYSLIAWGILKDHPEQISTAMVAGEQLRMQPVYLARLAALRGAALARLDHADSARVAVQRATRDATGDIELVPVLAAIHALLGDRDTAISLLTGFISEAPGKREDLLMRRWYWPLHGNQTTARSFAASVLTQSQL